MQAKENEADLLVEEPQALPGRHPIAIVRRTATGVTKRHNWIQLVKFGAVGGSGYVINLIVFAALTKGFDADPILAAVGAFVVAVSNNFLLNRHWTFGAKEGETGFQALRFFVISVGALAINLIALKLFVDVANLDELASQALAVAIAMPFNFVGNKVWTFSWETLE